MLLQNKTFPTRRINATMGSTVTKMIMMVTIMVAVITVAPQVILAQRDEVLVDQPPSLLEDIDTKHTSPDNIWWSQDSELITPELLPSTVYDRKLSPVNYKQITAGKRSYKINPATVLSYSKGGWAWSTLCSTIARINLNSLTWLPYQSWIGSSSTIARGDAYSIASVGVARGWMITTSIASIEVDLWSQYYQTNHTIYDVYFYKGSNYGVMQWHRAVVFIGTDDQIYILDTIRGIRWIAPQLLSSHFAADKYRGYSVYISKNSYIPASKYLTMEEYYSIQDTISLRQLVQDEAVTIENKGLLHDDITLIVTKALKINGDNDQEIIVEVGAQITIKDAKTLMWWDLVYRPLVQENWLEAVFSKPVFAHVSGPLDR